MRQIIPCAECERKKRDLLRLGSTDPASVKCIPYPAGRASRGVDCCELIWDVK